VTILVDILVYKNKQAYIAAILNMEKSVYFYGVGDGCHAVPRTTVGRIENTQSASRGKREVFSIHGFAGTGRATFPTEGWLCPNKRLALRKDGSAGTGQALRKCNSVGSYRSD
jgi:hypothetical protein